MKELMKAVKVADCVYWVGAVDWGIRNFHGYLTSRGTTYNAYLVVADKITLIDTVKAPFKEELMSRVASVIDPADIDYIISNHSEMDHSGCLPDVIKEVKPEKVFASTIGVKTLFDHFHMDSEITALKDGESLSLGDMNLTFLETRMLHWPDSMITYLAENKLLFSQDGFGMHLASTERFADELDPKVLEQEAAKYYANILTPYSPLITKLLERVKTLDLPIETIAPDHGPIWRENLGDILGLYAKWADRKPTDKAVIMYDTMWNSTAKMAKAIQEGLTEGGATVKVMPLEVCHRSDIATEILDAGALLVGSPTLNNNIYPTLADALTYIKGLRFQKLIGAAFGSYGWSGEAVKQIIGMLREMKLELVGDGINVKNVPDDEALAKCHALGYSVALKMKEVLDHGK